MAIRLFRENGSGCHLEWYEKTASTAFTFDDPIAIGAAGRLVDYTAGGAFPFLGLIQRTWAADDATTTRTPVLVCGEAAEYLIDATTTAAALTDVGEYVDYVAATLSVNVGASANDEFYITGFLSTVLVIGKLRRRLPGLFE
jgi:hypothetical protein